jgi:hypothetical protein
VDAVTAEQFRKVIAACAIAGVIVGALSLLHIDLIWVFVIVMFLVWL